MLFYKQIYLFILSNFLFYENFFLMKFMYVRHNQSYIE